FTKEAFKRPTGAPPGRSVYTHVQRTLSPPTLPASDVPDGNQTCLRRARSTTPVQALTLLNDPTFRECASALGSRLLKAGPERDERLPLRFRLSLAPPPTAPHT